MRSQDKRVEREREKGREREREREREMQQRMTIPHKKKISPKTFEITIRESYKYYNT